MILKGVTRWMFAVLSSAVLMSSAQSFDSPVSEPDVLAIAALPVNDLKTLGMESGKLNAGAVEAALTMAKERGKTTVLLPSGIHYIGRTIQLNDPSGLVLDGNGATLIFTNQARHIDICNSVDFVLRNLTLDIEPLPFTQGIIVDMDPQGRWYEIQVDKGYPQDDEFVRFLTEESHCLMGVIDPETRANKKGAPEYISRPDVEKIGDGLLRVTSNNGAVTNPYGMVQCGDSVVIWRRLKGGFRTQNARNCTFSNITIHASAGSGIYEINGDGGNRYDHIRVTPGPKPREAERKRLRSTNADAFHSYNMKTGPVIENCRFEMMGDDGVNVHGFYNFILKQEENKLILSSRNIDSLQSGDQVQMIDGSSYNVLENSKIVRLDTVSRPDLVEQATALWKGRSGPMQWKDFSSFYVVELDHVPDVKPGDLLTSMERCGAGAQIRNNVFHGNRTRGILINAPDSIIENNRFSHLRAGVAASPLPIHFLESTFAQRIVIRGNEFVAMGTGAPDATTRMPGAISVMILNEYGGFERDKIGSGRGHQNVVIENNTIRDSAYYGIVAANVDGLRISGNRIVNRSDLLDEWPVENFLQYPVNSGVVVVECSKVCIEDNSIEHLPCNGIFIERCDDVNLTGNNQITAFAADLISPSGISGVYLKQVSSAKIKGLSVTDPRKELDAAIQITGGSDPVQLANNQFDLASGVAKVHEGSKWNVRSVSMNHFVVENDQIFVSYNGNFAWTIAQLKYKGTELVGQYGGNGSALRTDEAGRWGSDPMRFVGSIHGAETVEAFRIFVDGEPHSIESGINWMAGEVKTVKTSRLGPFLHTAEISFPASGDYIKEKHSYKVVENPEGLDFLYAYMHCMNKRIAEWNVLNAGGMEKGGSRELGIGKNFQCGEVKAITCWDEDVNQGLVYVYPEIYRKSADGVGNWIWVRERDTKLYFRAWLPPLEIGTEFSFTVKLIPFESSAENWKQTGRDMIRKAF